MARRDFIQPTFDPDDLVSYNIRAARELRGWTQEEASDQLKEYGLEWSVASMSDAERAWDPVKGRNREFTATDIIRFAVAFDLPVSYFLLPIERAPDSRLGIPYGCYLDIDEYLQRLFGSSPEVEERLVSLGARRTVSAPDRARVLAILDQQQTFAEQVLSEIAAARRAVLGTEPSADESGGGQR